MKVLRLLQRLWKEKRVDCRSSIKGDEKEILGVAGNEHNPDIEIGRELAAKGMHAEALRKFEHVLHISPESALSYRYAAEQALVLGDVTSAQDYLALALHYAPSDVASASLLVRTYIERRDHARAQELVRKFLQLHGGNSDLLFQAARCDYLAGHFDHAKTGLLRLLESQPEHPSALNLLGLIIAREFGDLDAGESLIRRALRGSPEFKAAWSNLGWIVSERGDIEQALNIFERILVEDRDDDETRLMRAHANLKHGRFRAGWGDFESRHASPLALPGMHSFPILPHGINTDGLSVLVYEEQGLGDQIMFSSCIPDLVESGARVTIQCDTRLKTLFSRSFPNCHVIGRHEVVPKGIDYQIAIGSLPRRYRNRLEDFPAHQGYLCADAQRVLHWRGKLLALGSGPYVGISWRGGVQATRRQLRSVPLGDWMSLLGGPGQFVSLQYGDISETEVLDRSRGVYLHHWPEAIADYDETAALVLALDAVVSVCTSVVHLAGALGRRVYVLTPAQPEWRYMYLGDRLPWYPATRLFRQHEKEPWHEVMLRLKIAMHADSGERGDASRGSLGSSWSAG